MKDIRAFSLYSGSSGNAFLLATPEGCILVDAGRSARRLTGAIRECGFDAADVRAIFLTHEHNDHVSALSVFLKQHPIPVHLPAACAARLEADPAVAPFLVPHPPVDTVAVGGVTVRSFPTPHDSLGSVGYRFEIPTEGGIFRLGYATDVGTVTEAVEEALTGCGAVVLESNHDPEMLATGPYPADLKHRIASRRGHLSNPESADFCARLCASGTKSVLLAHLSRENNTPDTAYSEHLSAIADANVRLCVADPDNVVEMDLEDLISC